MKLDNVREIKPIEKISITLYENGAAYVESDNDHMLYTKGELKFKDAGKRAVRALQAFIGEFDIRESNNVSNERSE